MTNNHDTSPLGVSPRTDQVASWLGWHLGELVGVGVPLVLAITVSGWFGVASMVVLAAWVVHELRMRRQLSTATRTVRMALPPGVAVPGVDGPEVPGEPA